MYVCMYVSNMISNIYGFMESHPPSGRGGTERMACDFNGSVCMGSGFLSPESSPSSPPSTSSSSAADFCSEVYVCTCIYVCIHAKIFILFMNNV